MTVQEAVLDLLSYANIYGFALSGVPEDEMEIVRAVAGVNQAIQIIGRDGPATLKYGKRSAWLRPATAFGPLNVTQNSISATLTGNFFESWRGCSLLLDGDGVLNRIMDLFFSSTNNLTTVTLLRPYSGATGTVGGTIYGDCVILDADVEAVLEPVTIPPNTRLYPAQDSVDFMHTYTWNRYAWPYYWICPVSGRHCCYIPFWSSWEKTIGNPQRYRVERRDDTARLGGTLYLSVNPIPTAGMNITFDIYRSLPQISRADLNESGGDDPNVELDCLPPDLIESFLMPIARWKYLASHPAIKNREARATLQTEYTEAMMRLKNGMSLTPQVNLTRARYL